MRALATMVVAAVLTHSTPASACGDKFLTAVCNTGPARTDESGDPAVVVLYRPSDAPGEGGVADPELEEHLRDAGWKVEITRGVDSLRAALAKGPQAVLVDLPSLEEVQASLGRIQADTVLVPVLSHPSRAEFREAAKDFSYILRTPSGQGHVQSVLTKVLQRGA